MVTTQLAPPYPIFTDRDGSPLDAGYLYFGEVNENPETNPIQIYYDSAFTQPAAQPLRTSNGYVMRNGSPALVYAGSQFSVTVRNKKSELVIYSPVGYGVTPGTAATLTDQMTYNEGSVGAVNRVLTSRLQDRVSVKDFGAVGDGVTDDTAAIQAAIDVTTGHEVVFPGGTYCVSSTINLDSSYVTLRFNGATIKPIANNFTIFKATVDAYGVKVFDLCVRGAGTTGVKVFDMFRWVRQGAALVRADIDSVNTGVLLNELCYGLFIDSPNIFNTDNPIIVKGTAGALKILHPMIDMYAKAGVGIDIFDSASYANVGVQIIGGAVEGGTIGIRDASVNTQVIGTYFERNTEADISLISGSRFFYGEATSHTATGGVVAIKGRSTDAARIFHPFMSNGARSTGLFDFNGTNTNCYYDILNGASSYNLPLGVVAGINTVSNKPGPIGGITPNTGAFTTLSSSGTATLATARSGGWSQSIASATPTTFLTLSGGGDTGRYDMSAVVAFSGGPAQYTAIATVIWDGSGGRIIANNGANLILSLSGGSVRVEQTSGSALTVYTSWIKIA